MEIFILICVIMLLIVGVIGSIIPVIPGPPISYVALLVYHFFIDRFSLSLVLFVGISVVLITFLDYFMQIYAVKKAGGGKYAIRGSIIGILLGILLLPPFGILVGAFVGAFIGAKIEMKKNKLKIACGAVWGFILGTIMKLCVSFYIIYILL